MRLVDAEQIVEAPHAFGELRLRKDPAAAKAAEAVHFGQAVGDHELGPEVHRCAARRNGVEIDLIDQNTRPALGREAAYCPEILIFSQGAARVVEIGEYDQARL